MRNLELIFRLLGYSVALLLLADSLLRACLLCLRATKSERASKPESKASKGCVILIAAHDEAGTIGPTVTALKEHLVEWPGSKLWVVADRCADRTALEAAVAGAQVAERAAGNLGKGAVIAWWLSKHEREWRDRDAVLILDADSRLVKGSLRALGSAMAAASDDLAAVQSYVAPDADASAVRLAGWSEVLMQRIDDEARRRCGWAVPLRGTGMAFRGEVLAGLAPRLHTLAEDLELDILLASQRKRVEFVPDAITLDPKPRQVAGASRQRARWIEGQLQVVRDYPREILSSLVTGGLNTWFLLPLLLLRPKVLFMGMRGLLLLLSVWAPALFWPAILGLGLDLTYYLSAVAVVDNPRRYLFDLITSPRYVVMWLYSIGITALRRGKNGQREWLRAGR